MSSTLLQAGSSRKSLSIKNNKGMSTSSPANSFCSSKQKHSTFEKYGAIYKMVEWRKPETRQGAYPIRRYVVSGDANEVFV